MTHAWPGNIRELEATIARAALTAPDEIILADHIEFLHAPAAPSPVAFTAASAPTLAPLRDVERAHIQHVLDAVSWNKKRAAEILDIGRETLYRKIAEFDLKPGM